MVARAGLREQGDAGQRAQSFSNETSTFRGSDVQPGGYSNHVLHTCNLLSE